MYRLSLSINKLIGSSNRIDQGNLERNDRVDYKDMRKTRIQSNRRSPFGWHRYARGRLVDEEERTGTCCLSKAVEANTMNLFNSVAHSECRW